MKKTKYDVYNINDLQQLLQLDCFELQKEIFDYFSYIRENKFDTHTQKEKLKLVDKLEQKYMFEEAIRACKELKLVSDYYKEHHKEVRL